MNFLLHFIIDNFLAIIMLLVLITLVSIEVKNVGGKNYLSMYVLIFAIVILLIVDYVDLKIANMGISISPNINPYYKIRFVASAIGYMTRPILFLCAITFIYNTDKKTNLIISIPAVITAISALLSFYNGFLFSVSEHNVWSPGKGRIVYIASTVFYMAMLIVFLILQRKKISKRQRIAIFFMIVSISGSSIIDIIFNLHDHYLPPAIILSFFFYYLYYYTDKTNRVIELKTKELEVQEAALKASQIRPHFIYNTLNTIYSLCYENPELAGQTTLNFSRYLRGTVDIAQNKTTIPIEEELKHTEYYTNIEKSHFPEIEVKFNINDGGYNVPFLIIQPMVENAIRHGIRGLKNGKVTIDLYKEEKRNKTIHHIVISDNGNGHSRANTALGEHNGIGISNVRSRVEALSNGKFDINMSEFGTVVKIEIPE